MLFVLPRVGVSIIVFFLVDWPKSCRHVMLQQTSLIHGFEVEPQPRSNPTWKRRRQEREDALRLQYEALAAVDDAYHAAKLEEEVAELEAEDEAEAAEAEEEEEDALFLLLL